MACRRVARTRQRVWPQLGLHFVVEFGSIRLAMALVPPTASPGTPI